MPGKNERTMFEAITEDLETLARFLQKLDIPDAPWDGLFSFYAASHDASAKLIRCCHCLGVALSGVYLFQIFPSHRNGAHQTVHKGCRGKGFVHEHIKCICD